MTNFLSFFSSKTAIGIEVRFLHRQQTTAVLAFASDSSNPASVDERDWFWVLCHSFGQRQYAHVTWSRPQLCHRIQWRSPIQSFILSKRFQTRYVLPIIRTVFYGLNKERWYLYFRTRDPTRDGWIKEFIKRNICSCLLANLCQAWKS